MAGIWDSNLKRLVAANLQHFVTWPLMGAQIIGELSTPLNRAIDIDTLYEVLLDRASQLALDHFYVGITCIRCARGQDLATQEI